jgi:hypothetical protein
MSVMVSDSRAYLNITNCAWPTERPSRHSDADVGA